MSRVRFNFKGTAEEILKNPQFEDMYMCVVEVHDLKKIHE